MVPRLAILPIWVAAGAAMITDGGIGLVLMIGLILAYAAAITSLGLAVATWVPRLGRVITVSVMAYVLVAVGWPLVLQVLPSLPAFRMMPVFGNRTGMASPSGARSSASTRRPSGRPGGRPAPRYLLSAGLRAALGPRGPDPGP